MGVRTRSSLHDKLGLHNNGLRRLLFVRRVPARLLRDGGEARLAVTRVSGRVSAWRRCYSTLGRVTASHGLGGRCRDAVGVGERNDFPSWTHQGQDHREEE